jgi:hypothetical protein
MEGQGGGEPQGVADPPPLKKILGAKSFLGNRAWARPFLNFAPGANLSPRVQFCPLGEVRFSVCPSILLNSRECSPLGPNKGVNISRRGQMSLCSPEGWTWPCTSFWIWSRRRFPAERRSGRERRPRSSSWTCFHLGSILQICFGRKLHLFNS